MNAAVRADIFLSCFRRQDLFADLDDEQIRTLASGSVVMSFAKGEVVCEKGFTPDGLFCLVDGKVKLSVLSAQGIERVVEIVTPGQTFGEAMLFSSTPCPIYAESLSKSQLLFLRKGRILGALRRYPELGLALLRCMSERQNRLVHDVEACWLQSAGKRVAGYLLKNAATDRNGPALVVSLPAGKAVVASTLNLTPETFSRELHCLASEGLIEVDRRTIRIRDADRLRFRVAG